MAAGQRIGDRRLQQLLPRRLEPPVGHPQLVGHVLEHEQVDAERAERVQHGVDDEDVERELAGGQHARHDERGRQVRDGRGRAARTRPGPRRSSAARSAPPRTSTPAPASSDRREQVAGHEHARRRRARSGASRNQAPTRRRIAQAVRPDEARLPVEIARSRRTAWPCRCRGTATGRRRRAPASAALVAARDQQHRRRDQQPAGRPQQDERLAPVRVLKQEQAADDRRAERRAAARVDGTDGGSGRRRSRTAPRPPRTAELRSQNVEGTKSENDERESGGSAERRLRRPVPRPRPRAP